MTLTPHADSPGSRPRTPGADETPPVEDLVGRRIGQLQQQYARSERPTAWAAATMAALRSATPGRIDEAPASWEVVYSTLPEILLGRGDTISREERAAHASLVLYAVHQMSQARPMHHPGVRLGHALARLPNANEDKSPVLRRFTSLVTASTFDATVYHLRSLITLLRREAIGVDHVRLCRDLVRLQKPQAAPAVRRQWGRDLFGSRGVDTPDGSASKPAAAR